MTGSTLPGPKFWCRVMKTRLPLGVIAIPIGYRPALMVRDVASPEPVLTTETEWDQALST